MSFPYLRRPGDARIADPFWCIKKCEDGRFIVQVWVPGEGQKYIGTYDTLEKAQQKRNAIRERICGVTGMTV